MIRTQISLEEREYALVKKEAAALGISIAELVRRALRQAFPVNDQAPWMRYAGLVASGDSNSSQSIDEIVYGTKD
jgi:Ribbon-helix-helix protein, copG family